MPPYLSSTYFVGFSTLFDFVSVSLPTWPCPLAVCVHTSSALVRIIFPLSLHLVLSPSPSFPPCPCSSALAGVVAREDGIEMLKMGGMGYD